jgi:hypothetical protein
LLSFHQNKNKTFYHYVVSAIYIPPEQDQAFNQGATFVFDDEETIFAHYDESTGAHSDIQQVIDLTKDRLSLDA